MKQWIMFFTVVMSPRIQNLSVLYCYAKWTRIHRLGAVPPLAILVFVFLTILALLFLNASVAPKREELLLPLPDEDIPGATQDNVDLIAYIKQLHIRPPSGKDYNLQNPEVEDPSEHGQGRLIGKIFSKKKGGTFLDAGAHNGEEHSNTLYLERVLRWTGLLVEPNPWYFWSLRRRFRNAYSLHACLSPFPYPREVSLRQSNPNDQTSDSSEARQRGVFTRVKCFPLYSMMLAQNLTKLDLLALNIKGKEIQVLKTLPWAKIDVKTILITSSYKDEDQHNLKNFLQHQYYNLNSTIGRDLIFVKS